MHRADCTWLEIITELEHFKHVAAVADKNLFNARAKILEYHEAFTDMTAKLQFLINWSDSHGLFGDEHCFTFPDGDTWKPK